MSLTFLLLSLILPQDTGRPADDGRISGQVVDAVGEPLADLTVSALRRTALAGPMGFLMAHGAQTNDLGEFSNRRLA